jgi:hypothetical protein
MSTQNVSAVCGNPTMSKIFDNSASVDGQWNNTMVDTIASQNIGILIPNTTLTYIQPSYEAGCQAWRLQNAQSLNVSAFGFGVKSGQENFSQSRINAVKVNPNDILTSYTLITNPAPALSNALAWVTTTKGSELFSSESLADSTAGELKSVVNNMTLGDQFFNSTLTSITVQMEDGALCDSIQLIDEMGGVKMSIAGGYRGLSPSSESNSYNLSVTGLNVPIGKGWSFKIIAVSE